MSFGQLKQPYAWVPPLALAGAALAAALGVPRTEIGQALLGVLVSLIGYALHRKAHNIEVIVNGRTTQLMERVDQLEQALLVNGHKVPPAPPAPPEVLPVPAA